MLAAPALAQTGPVIAIPGKFGVPVIMNGVIVDGAVIWGDWGLARPTHGVVVDGLVEFAPPPYDSRSYYPQTGRKPRVGRQEVQPASHRARPTNFPARLVHRVRLQSAGHRISAVRSAASDTGAARAAFLKQEFGVSKPHD